MTWQITIDAWTLTCSKNCAYPRACAPWCSTPPAGFLENLGVEVHTQSDGTPYPFVLLFVKDSVEFFALTPIAVKAVVFDALFWLASPKKSGAIQSDLSRDIVWELMKATGTGLRPVTQVAIDATWSALRFRPEEKVGK